ncbi:MAG TPA: hypothetical protein VFQ53_16305 [Kofleriaceae bacterium]|nr:hypothetical protein [Kofleriaceae bacterium]
MISLAATAGLSCISGCREPGSRVERTEQAAKAQELDDAKAEFAHHRALRIGTFRGEHLVARTQPMLVSALASATPLTAAAQADITDKIRVFQLRLDEAGNAIEALRAVPVGAWAEREADVARLLLRLEAARDAAWEALREGTRITSS